MRRKMPSDEDIPEIKRLKILSLYRLSSPLHTMAEMNWKR